jgi:predicted nucleic acid-binding protein
MNAEAFFDSNVLLYVMAADIAKAARAGALIDHGGVISVQVLNEFANVAFLKFKLTYAEIRETLHAIRALCSVEPLDIETHELALDIAERYRFDIFDSLIVAAALRAKCSILYTEDLQHGQKIDGLTIRNPFTS